MKRFLIILLICLSSFYIFAAPSNNKPRGKVYSYEGTGSGRWEDVYSYQEETPIFQEVNLWSYSFQELYDSNQCFYITINNNGKVYRYKCTYYQATRSDNRIALYLDNSFLGSTNISNVVSVQIGPRY